MTIGKAVLISVVCGLFSTLSASGADPLKVASFSTVLTEIAQEVGGNHVSVAGLVKPGQDPHEYEPTPDDLKQVADAKLILLSGKHLEHYLDKVQQATGGKAESLSVGDALPNLKMKADPDEPQEKAEADRNGLIDDPHWWNSVVNVEKATTIVRDELIKLDPTNREDYQSNAKSYLAKLGELDKWANRKVAELPRNKRKLVTSHDAFQYLAKDYGFTVYAIEGVSTETEPSDRHIADLIDEIKKQQVKAIFLENTLNPKVTVEITRETGAKIGGTLYADGLGEGDGSTYEGMIKHNITTIVDALK
ncbi:MAG TPA: zinc ABC transporter substrate-binding protein [Chthoniobacterales bacterium]|jgi:ABC-type Zn uptake system ZnuABC Zn-binding protein ZnuA|nr:zinc ABC transporter substrate-binding protein [Chthoniobacterales bacterium]